LVQACVGGRGTHSWQILIEAYLHTGCRRNELLWLTWEDVDFEQDLLRIRNKEGFRTKGKGMRRPERDLPLHPYLKTRLLILPRTSSFVFPSPVTGRPFEERAIDRRFRRLCRRIGFGDDVVIHTLRHTFASKLANAGYSPWLIAKLLGHVTHEPQLFIGMPVMTTRTTRGYLHETPETFEILRSVIHGLRYTYVEMMPPRSQSGHY